MRLNPQIRNYRKLPDATCMQYLTVTQFVAYLNETLKAVWDPTMVAVEGEVAEYKVSQGQWVNFTVKDDQAMISAFLVLARLSVPLQDGMRVRLYGYPRVYPKYGKFSFQAERVELVGEGSLRKALALLHQTLETEGLFDPSRKRLLPRFPRRIALVASRESAAYGDFVRILQERWRGMEIDLYHTPVQGDQAPESLVRAIERANKGHTSGRAYDALVMTRGGGALEELMAFNDERVVRAIHASAIPTLVGIGHERDLTFAEEAADVRGSTPTDCARRLVPDREDVLYEIAQQERLIDDRLSAWQRAWMERTIHALTIAGRWLETVKGQSDYLHAQIEQRVDYWLAVWRDRLASTDRLLRSLDPTRVLERGYAIVQDAEGRICTSVKSLAKNRRIRVRLQDGSVFAYVLDGQDKRSMMQERLL